MPREFTCFECGDTFMSDRPDHEARAEFARRFPGIRIEDAAVLCDRCAAFFERWAVNEGLLEDKEED